MEKIKSILRSKKFWTLVAAIVAALTAFFTTSCTGYQKIQRSGIHHDTVRYEQVLKHKNFVACLPTTLNPTDHLSCSRPSTSFACSSRIVFPTPSFAVSFSSPLTFQRPIPCSVRSIPLNTINSISSTTSNGNCSATVIPLSTSRSQRKRFGETCLALMLISLPLSRVTPDCFEGRRRGGRKGRPRPKIKNIPLGGSHF